MPGSQSSNQQVHQDLLFNSLKSFLMAFWKKIGQSRSSPEAQTESGSDSRGKQITFQGTEAVGGSKLLDFSELSSKLKLGCVLK